jgi:hypothetical protein
MTRADLIAASEIRRRSGLADLRLHALWRELASGMGDDQRVEDVYTEAQIDEIASSLTVRTNVQRRKLTITQEAAD